MNKKKIGFLIFARTSSKRFPNKVLRNIGKKPLLWYIFQRVKLISDKNIVIVTSNQKKDNKIVNFCQTNNIKYFRGSLNNVMKRSIDCCSYYKFDYFMRICADRPFLDFNLGKKMIKQNLKNYDLITNLFPKTFPSGLTCELIKVIALKKIFKKNLNDNFKEHICDYFYKNSKKFKIKNLRSNYNQKIINMNLSLNTKKDLKKVIMCYKYFNFDPKLMSQKAIKYFSK